MDSDLEPRDDVTFQSRTGGSKVGAGLDTNECASCLLDEKSMRQRQTPGDMTPGMNLARTVLPPPPIGRNNKRKDRTKSRLLCIKGWEVLQGWSLGGRRYCEGERATVGYNSVCLIRDKGIVS